MTKKRSRRLRKKLHKNEFAVFGFTFSCTLSTLTDSSDALLDRFLDFIESHDLVVGAGISSDSFDGFITSNERYGSVSEEQKAKIEHWLSVQPACLKVHVGELVDANA